jgi:hypothetical protein
MSRARHDEAGQASVELVALLPLVALVVAVLWQALLAGQALWSSAGAARAAARAQAIGGDPLVAARGALPGSLRRGLRVTPDGDGIRVAVRVPLAFTRAPLLTVDASAQLPPQR